MRPTVLIVDDTELMRFILRELLDSLPLGLIAEAGTPDEAIRLASALDPRLIVVDWTGPLPAGPLQRSLRAQRPDCRLAAAVTYDDTRTANRARETGAEAVLWKPYSPRDTLSVLRPLLTPLHPVCG